MAYYQKKSPEQLQAEMNALTAQLENGIEEVFTSGKLTDYLTMMAKFPNYSASNCLLIMLQRPTAKHVCGYVTWKKEFNRHVKKGENAIHILGGSPRKGKRKTKDENGKEVTEEYTYIKYFPCAVFADDQTEGDDLPELCRELKNNVDNYVFIKEKLKSIANVPIYIESTNSEAKGYFSPMENKIVVQDGMSESQTIKTMVHELTHSILHCKGGIQESADRDTKEIQAESVAFIVCHHLGIESDDYSFPYLASWASEKGMKAVRENLDLIQKTAFELIEKIA